MSASRSSRVKDRPVQPLAEGNGLGADFVARFPELRAAYLAAIEIRKPGRPRKPKPTDNPLEIELAIEAQLDDLEAA